MSSNADFVFGYASRGQAAAGYSPVGDDDCYLSFGLHFLAIFWHACNGHQLARPDKLNPLANHFPFPACTSFINQPLALTITAQLLRGISHCVQSLRLACQALC